MLSDESFQTVVITGGGVITAFISFLGGLRFIKGRRRRALLEPEEEREAVERYAADPNQFVRDVLRSNDQLTKRVDAAEKKVEVLQRTIDNFREKDRKFRNALARWFVDIMAAFEQNNIEMPYPRAGDDELLSDVIPSALEATRPQPPRNYPI